jgi:hypothetical protein
MKVGLSVIYARERRVCDAFSSFWVLSIADISNLSL